MLQKIVLVIKRTMELSCIYFLMIWLQVLSFSLLFCAMRVNSTKIVNEQIHQPAVVANPAIRYMNSDAWA